MWKKELEKDLLDIVKKYNLTMMVFAGTVKNSKECLVCAGGHYDQMIYGISGIVEKISNADETILMDDVIHDVSTVTLQKSMSDFV